ncbi:MAG: hypothetical protein HUK08_00425 [Bacteroidaceae bacterium]|nr:hypothetical protein [Bacteroidaceae bacterium]
MIAESLYIKVVQNGEVKPFPNADNPARIGKFTHTRQRMGSAPTITATLEYPICLDELWTHEEYVEFKGERYYADQTPTSSKDNTNLFYKHEITFVSERIKLENTYFLDVVTPLTPQQYKDRKRSNSTDVKFFGDVHELCARINDSLLYSKLDSIVEGQHTGYHIEIDDPDLRSETLEVSFDTKFVTEALQFIYSTFKIPYYFVGKTIHVGQYESFIGGENTLEYGDDKGFLSVTKTNANQRLIDRITGCGGDQNIPYYYPNENESGTAKFSTLNFGSTPVSIDLSSVYKYNASENDTYYLERHKSSENGGKSFMNAIFSLDGYFDDFRVDKKEEEGKTISASSIFNAIKQHTTTVWKKRVYCRKGERLSKGWDDTEQVEGIMAVQSGEFKWHLYGREPETKAFDYPAKEVGKSGFALQIWNADDTEEDSTIVDGTVLIEGYYWVHIAISIVPPMFPEDFDATFHVDYIRTQLSIKSGKQSSFTLLIHRTLSDNDIYHSWQYDTDKHIAHNKSGFVISAQELAQLPAHNYLLTYDHSTDEWTESYTPSPNPATIILNGRSYIQPTGKLMPSIYRTSGGEERFYNAKNNTYPDGKGGYVIFKNLYHEGNPHEYKQDFTDIYPTIKGMRNAHPAPTDPTTGKYIYESDAEYDDEGQQITGLNQNMAVIADVAFDEHDSDETDTEGNYLHPYFYIKLRKFDGNYGFSLFDQASAESKAVIEITSGTCAACSFTIKATEGLKNPVHVDANGNLVPGDYTDRISANNLSPNNQDTQTNELWIAVEKDADTFGTIMPHAVPQYRPKAGDSFVITGIEMPTEFIYAAEARLDNALIEYMKQNNEEKFTFSITFSRNFVASHDDLMALVNENAVITIRYNDGEYLLFVKTYTIKSDGKILYEVTVELSDDLEQGSSALRTAVSAATTGLQQTITSDTIARATGYFIRKNIIDQVNAKTQFAKGITIGRTIDNVDASKARAERTTDATEEETLITRGIDEYGNADLQSLKLDNGSGIDKEGNASLQSVSLPNGKGIDSEAKGILKSLVADILQSEDFSSGNVGNGFKMWVENNTSKLEIDELLVRKLATFLKLEIRELSYVGGNLVVSQAGSTIKTVVGVDANGNEIRGLDGRPSVFWQNGAFVEGVKRLRCYWASEDGNTMTTNTWLVDDQAKCQTMNAAIGTYDNTSNRYYYRRIKAVGDDYIEFSTDDNFEEHCPSTYNNNANCIPAIGDKIIQYGYRLVTEDEHLKKRTTLVGLYTNSDNSPSIEIYEGLGVGRPDSTGYTDPSTYWTTIDDNRVVLISPQGVEFNAKYFKFTSEGGYKYPTVYNCGDWETSPHIGYQYQQYYFEGGTFNVAVPSTQQDPIISDGQGGWKVSDGWKLVGGYPERLYPPYMEIEQSMNGSLAPNESEQVTITVRQSSTQEDLTPRFIYISVTRDSGDPPSDAVWNASHTSVTNPFTIAFSDLNIDGIHRLATIFTVVASDTSGQQIQNTVDFFS